MAHVTAHVIGLTFYGQATPSVQAVTVLTDESFQESLFHQFHQHHVGGGGDCLEGGLGLDGRAPCLALGSQLPHSRPCLHLSVHTTAKVRDWEKEDVKT